MAIQHFLGKTRAKDSGMNIGSPLVRNALTLKRRYADILSGNKQLMERRTAKDANIDWRGRDSFLTRVWKGIRANSRSVRWQVSRKLHALKIRVKRNPAGRLASRATKSASWRMGKARNKWSSFLYRTKLKLGLKRPPRNVAELNSLLLHSRAYLHDLEVPILAACAKTSPGTIVEIGSAFGASSAILLSNMPDTAILHSIDPFIVDSMGDTLHASKETCTANVRNVLTTLGMANKLDTWDLRPEYSHNVVKSWSVPIDMIFIDGDHRYPAVKADFEQWFPFVKKGGLVLFHDSRKEKGTPDNTFNRGWAGPTKLADELRRDPRVKLVNEAFSITVWKKL